MVTLQNYLSDYLSVCVPLEDTELTQWNFVLYITIMQNDHAECFSELLCGDQIQNWLDCISGGETPWIDAFCTRIQHTVLLGQSEILNDKGMHYLLQTISDAVHFFLSAQ